MVYKCTLSKPTLGFYAKINALGHDNSKPWKSFTRYHWWVRGTCNYSESEEIYQF